MVNDASALGFTKALKVFDQFAPEVLHVDLSIKGKPSLWDLLNLLSLGNSFDDPIALGMMADKLPAMLVFFGAVLGEAQVRQAQMDEEIELFVQEKWQGVLEELVKKIDRLTDDAGKKIPASLKSAPTKDGIRAAIVLGNRAVMDDLKARKAEADRDVRSLENIVRGIEKRIQLLNSQLNVMNTMVRRGVSGL